MMNEVITIAGMAVLDRIRGHDIKLFERSINGITKLLFGCFVAYSLGVTIWWQFAALAILFALGSAPGWGDPIGRVLYQKDDPKPEEARYEWWQVGILQDNPILALISRGLIWGAPPLLLIYFIPNVWVIAVSMSIAMPFSAYVIGKFVPWSEKYDKWHLMEYLRGGLFGAILGIIS